MDVEPSKQPEKNGKQQKKPVFRIHYFERFKFPHKTYKVELTKDISPVLEQIIKNKRKLLEMALTKYEDMDEEISEIADYETKSILEFYLMHLDPDHPNYDNNEKCSICMFEFFDDIEKTAFDQINDNLKGPSDEDIIQLEHCDGHYFHKGCLKNYISSQTATYIKCPICCHIYGEMIGDQPLGTMTHSVQKNLHCDGFDKCGTIIINYHFNSEKLPGGKHYFGTSRTAYLPDNDDGRECLRLLKLSFDRRLTFTIGTSVTTGRQDSVIWNGIHHKTNTHGGPTNYGFPDPTYFNRLKQELASKGVV